MVSGEFANRADLSRALKGCDIAYHFISMSNPYSSWLDPYLEIENNLKHSVQLIEVAAEQGVKKIAFTSSGGMIYGRQTDVINESSLPLPYTPYGICKLTIEYFLAYAKERYGIFSDIYRIGNAYGPRQPLNFSQGVIAVWMGLLAKGKPITVYGNMEAKRDYIYVEDIANLMGHSLVSTQTSNVFNVGTGKGTSIRELLDLFKDKLDVPINVQLTPHRPHDNQSIILDSSKILKHFPGFSFKLLEEKIEPTWQYYKDRFSRIDS